MLEKVKFFVPFSASYLFEEQRIQCLFDYSSFPILVEQTSMPDGGA